VREVSGPQRRWGPWLRLADKSWFYIEQKMWFPICFELALGPTHADSDAALEPVYLGTAAHEEELFDALEQDTAPYSPQLRAALQAGKVLYYRTMACPQRDAAEALRAARAAEHGAYARGEA